MKFRACALALVALCLSACGSDVENTPGDPAPPRVTVTASVSGFESDDAMVRLTGRVTAPGTLADLTARLNDGEAVPVEVTAVSGTWTFEVDLTLREGDNTVQLEAVDPSGGKGSQVTTVRYVPDTESPQVQVVSPDEGLAITVRRVRVEAVATDNKRVVGVSYSLNGGEEQSLDAPANAEGTLAFAVTPRPGANVVTLKARDARGNTDESTVSFHFGGLASAGGLHSGAVRSGLVYTWGRKHRGQLGLGTPPVEGETRTPDVTPRYSATRVPGLTGAVAVGPGFRHSLVLMEDGTVRAFGNNQNGQLGDGTTEPRDYPVVVSSLTDVVNVIGGSMHSAALKRDGTVWVWGQNQNGQLALGFTVQSHPEPTASSAEVAPLSSMGMGATHVIAVRGDGSVFAWGWNLSGSLGPDGVINSWSYPSPIPVPLP